MRGSRVSGGGEPHAAASIPPSGEYAMPVQHVDRSGERVQLAAVRRLPDLAVRSFAARCEGRAVRCERDHGHGRRVMWPTVSEQRAVVRAPLARMTVEAAAVDRASIGRDRDRLDVLHARILERSE